ncbi:hypothetical protein SAMN05421837_12117 [Amycolatopsis pretoriensis]|uniref:Uncharacterized protein n=1 Tax=Amycolatopsis pretoriensis TaxID=218821 RepID=A0A1H5RJ60_9PSEU|nr:hypothetical protein [Amycolatopsis pretoriensis]SEF38386.1 hypothetical protein SAMN05421837_12117 [Amycolatopsis pretoriensis]
MRGHGWHGAPLIVPARTPAGSATQVSLGLIDTAGGLVRAIRVGGDGQPAILPRQAMAELVSHAQVMLDRDLPGDQR